MIDLKIEEVIFENYTLSFALPLTDPKVADLFEGAPIDYDGEFFIISTIEDDRDESGIALKRVEAEARWTQLADYSRPGTFALDKATAVKGLTTILTGTPWIVDVAPDSSDTFSLEATDASVLDLLWQWARITGNELSFGKDNRTVQMLPEIGADNSLAFRYESNLRSVKRRAEAPAATRLYAYGRNDLTIGTLNGGREYVEDYSYYTGLGYTINEARDAFRKDVILYNDTFVDAASLHAWALDQIEVMAQPKITYEAAAADLSQILHIQDDPYRCGDIVRVSDPIIGVDQLTRVTRRVVYPLEPIRNEVELSFGQVDIPSPNTSSSRPSTSQNWEMFESRNNQLREVRLIPTILHKVILRTVEDAEWVVHYQVEGVGVSSTTVTFEFYDAETDEEIWPSKVVSLTDGQPFEYSFSFGRKLIPSGTTELVIKAYSDSSAGGIQIAESESAFWVLARGTTRASKNYPNSVRYDGPLFDTFEVPEFITELEVECVAAGPADVWSGSGTSIKAKLAVTPFQLIDVYAAGCGGDQDSAVGGFPNGGSGDKPGLAPKGGAGGGGSTSIRPSGGTFDQSWIVAPGGGGSGTGQTDVYEKFGGNGGFIVGNDGGYLGGNGATQFAGGTNPETPAAAGSFGQGGTPPHSTNSFYFGGGGGGGGWYGGAGGDEPIIGGFIGGGGGGGGGSGYVQDVYDVEVQDEFNTAPEQNGWVIISWPDPDLSQAQYT